MPDMPLEWDSTRQMIITTRDVDVCAWWMQQEQQLSTITQEEEILFSLPERLSINLNKLEMSRVSVCLRAPDADPRACLILFLLYESIDPASFWTPYLRTACSFSC
jgi:hypothetical protein